jgi:hypothetical protein
MPPMRLRSKDLRLRTFVYQPLSVKGKYAGATMVEFPFCRVQVGDLFTIDKRTDFAEMGKSKKYKVEDCYFTTANKGEFIIILEKEDFSTKNQLKLHTRGKTVK